MEVDRFPTGRTLRRRNEKVAKHLKRGANEKEKESFRKRVFRIPLDKPYDEAYFTHRLWMFFRETRETEEDIRRMFSSIETHTATSIDSAQEKLTDRAEDESVDSHHGEWENDYHNPTMASHNMHTEEYDEDYEEERAIEKRATLDEEDRLLHHSFRKKKLPSINRNGSPSIDTQPHQPNHLRASTDIAYYPSIDTNDDATRDGDYSIGSWADDHHQVSYAVETAYRDQGSDELHEGFTYERLPGVAPPIRKSKPDSYADTHFTDEITLIEMPRKFSFPSIKAYNGTADPDDHVAKYRQRMLDVALPKGSREATMCKGFSSTMTGPALQWYINLPSRFIASIAVLSDKFVEQFASSRDLEKTSDSLYEILQNRAEPPRGYIARFNQEKVAIPECSIPTAISAFKRGRLLMETSTKS
ncbi:hypothetical protein F2Q69_00052345 [Brassica cretica]|uniref:Retrotransposon gag domain-containing protein n=1 Tax=Brassica cretica TaxID=69181 RepID=A0A8S9MYJ7_BRACR|nr:hypothetical protein F2Q69_00052345 [Brassica cretica]